LPKPSDEQRLVRSPSPKEATMDSTPATVRERCTRFLQTHTLDLRTEERVKQLFARETAKLPPVTRGS
jgi:hypothetical protein